MASKTRLTPDEQEKAAAKSLMARIRTMIHKLQQPLEEEVLDLKKKVGDLEARPMVGPMAAMDAAIGSMKDEIESETEAEATKLREKLNGGKK